LPVAPNRKKSVIAVTSAPPYASRSGASVIRGAKSRVPNVTYSRNMASRKPQSPIRFTMKPSCPVGLLPVLEQNRSQVARETHPLPSHEHERIARAMTRMSMNVTNRFRYAK